MNWIEWFQSLKPWQAWGILMGVALVWMKLAEWKEERRAIAAQKVIARTRKKAMPKSKKKNTMPPAVRKVRKKMFWEIDRIMEKQAQSRKGFDNSKAEGLNDIT